MDEDFFSDDDLVAKDLIFDPKEELHCVSKNIMDDLVDRDLAYCYPYGVFSTDTFETNLSEMMHYLQPSTLLSFPWHGVTSGTITRPDTRPIPDDTGKNHSDKIPCSCTDLAPEPLQLINLSSHLFDESGEHESKSCQHQRSAVEHLRGTQGRRNVWQPESLLENPQTDHRTFDVSESSERRNKATILAKERNRNASGILLDDNFKVGPWDVVSPISLFTHVNLTKRLTTLDQYN